MSTVGLSHVARRAGVSTATVSRVLNSRPGVATATREAVLQALDGLGYDVPEPMRRKSGGTVGVVIPELDNPVFTRFATALEEALSPRGLTQMICSQRVGGVHEDEHIRRLLGQGVSALVVASGIHAIPDSDPRRYAALLERGISLVLVNGHLEDVPTLFVSNDDVKAARLPVTHLRHLGHERIGLVVGPQRYSVVRRRIAGFVTAMTESGCDDPAGWISSSLFTIEGGEAAAAELLDRGATALVCASDLLALGAVRAATRAGLRVPQDVSVVGSDDNRFLEFTDPPLTTVRQRVEQIASIVVRGLFEALDGHPLCPQELLVSPELVHSLLDGAGPLTRACKTLRDCVDVAAGKDWTYACPRRVRPSPLRPAA